MFRVRNKSKQCYRRGEEIKNKCKENPWLVNAQGKHQSKEIIELWFQRDEHKGCFRMTTGKLPPRKAPAFFRRPRLRDAFSSPGSVLSERSCRSGGGDPNRTGLKMGESRRRGGGRVGGRGRGSSVENRWNVNGNSPAGTSRSENKVCVTHKAVDKQREQEYIENQYSKVLNNQRISFRWKANWRKHFVLEIKALYLHRGSKIVFRIFESDYSSGKMEIPLFRFWVFNPFGESGSLDPLLRFAGHFNLALQILKPSTTWKQWFVFGSAGKPFVKDPPCYTFRKSLAQYFYRRLLKVPYLRSI